MKRCTQCLEEKPEEEFDWKVKTVKRQSYCKDCHKKQNRAHYLANTSIYLQRAKKRSRKVKKENKDWLHLYKTTHPCVDCGESDPVVLDFHHLGKKDFTISQEMGNSIGIIQKEINKCVVLCSNCHRRRHYKDQRLYGGATASKPV